MAPLAPECPFPWSGVSQATLKQGPGLIHQSHFLYFLVVPTYTATAPGLALTSGSKISI